MADGSLAQAAGFIAGADYLLGTAERVFSDADALLDECQLHLDAAIEVYVYNVDSDEVRVAVVVPTYQWGGDGCLGADVAHGYLHRLPTRRRGSAAWVDRTGRRRRTRPSRRWFLLPRGTRRRPGGEPGSGNTGAHSH